jgi:hypothetical protein
MSYGSPPSGMDEYQRLMAERAASQKRKRLIYGVLLVAVAGGGGFWWTQQRKKANAAQEVLEAGGRFAERDKGEMGAFWNCVMSSEVDIGNFQNADQIQQRIESAYFTQQKTFSDHLLTECVPKIERARSAMGGLVSETPDELKPALEKYLATLPKLQAGIETYAEKIKGRGATKDVDASIQEVGAAFTADPSPESVAFLKFMACAIPDLDKKKDVQAVLEYLADVCKKDPVTFMTGVREKCGPLVQNVNKDEKVAPPKTFKATAKKFFEEDQRQLQAWEYCGKRSRKGKKQYDLEDLLTSFGDYMDARNGIKEAALYAKARITGEPRPAAKKPGAAAAAP